MKLAIVVALCLTNLILPIPSTWAGNQYGPGVSDTEIKVGNTSLRHNWQIGGSLLPHGQRSGRHQRA